MTSLSIQNFLRSTLRCPTITTTTTITKRPVVVTTISSFSSSSSTTTATSVTGVDVNLTPDKSHYVQTRKTSPYKLGKHRSNALSLLQQQPIIEVDGDRAICDGGGGALGHPLEYIKLGHRADYENEEEEAKGVACIYCGLRYRKKKGSSSSGHH